MFLVVPDLNFVITSEVWTFDCSFRASSFMFLDLLQIALDLARTKLVGLGNSFNHSVDDGVCSVLVQWSSASWTGCHVHSAVFTNNVTHGTGGHGDLPGDEETHGALELIRDIKGWDIIHFTLKALLKLVTNNK